jgi:hypothetical protein
MRVGGTARITLVISVIVQRSCWGDRLAKAESA